MKRSTKTLVAIPVFNGEDYIARTLDSCLNQTLKAEVWVVDNLSTDNTSDIVKRYCKQHSQIKYFRNKTNLGRVGNWNRCLDLFESSKFDYIKFVFAGDEILPECIKEIDLAFGKDKQIGAVIFPYYFVRKNGAASLSQEKKYFDRLFSSKEAALLSLSSGGILGAIIGNAYAKKYIGKTRFNEQFVIKTDFDLHVLIRGGAYYIGKPLARFNLDSHNTFAAANSSWCNAEFFYSNLKLLEEYKSTFSNTEYNQLKKDIVLTGIRNQLPFFHAFFAFEIVSVIVKYWTESLMRGPRYFFSYYWKKLTGLIR